MSHDSYFRLRETLIAFIRLKNDIAMMAAICNAATANDEIPSLF
ncbi:Uncharacterised protein [Serratia ficaria]|uniref:Uncharacterized protein n=1 Tax=Serratia ficaria TaxID=61651 RepID=A0A240C902_SERFI|nr:hypothetical protein C7332_2045 [Serratia ficaria]CAI0704438.1 Uncharacterised protein [Serratia ficaria]CAI0725200.1 Uncharacterised protein [Serratia ficaria]CAI0733931.1 Uncharacterised protein [Serratia ficaria]CAI0838220.1 Uncharacterised protein [Serratia ficaria]